MLGFRKVRVSASDSTTANRFWVTKLGIRGSLGQGNHFTSCGALCYLDIEPATNR